MEQMPHHREGIQNLMDKAYDEALDNNAEIEQLEARLRELKGLPEKVNSVEFERPIENKNSETGVSYESIDPNKVHIFELVEMKGKPLNEVATYVKEKFGDKYYVPNSGYKEYLLHNPGKVPESFNKGNNYAHLFLGDTTPLWHDPLGYAILGSYKKGDGSYGYDESVSGGSMTEYHPGVHKVVLIER